MITLINEVIDKSGHSYRLFAEINESSLKEHYDIRFFSTYSGASNPDKEQTKWKTTLPRESFSHLLDVFSDVAHEYQI